jgi:hypothetical protein
MTSMLTYRPTFAIFSVFDGLPFPLRHPRLLHLLSVTDHPFFDAVDETVLQPLKSPFGLSLRTDTATQRVYIPISLLAPA